VTRIVTAESAAEAGGVAISLLQTERKFVRMAAMYGHAPDLAVSEIALAPHSHIEQVNRSGYVFNEDD
jgi:hypothetical protein